MVIDPANHDDNTNEDDFLEMEKEILGRYGDDVWHSQIQTILKSWFPKLRQNARDEGSDKVNCKFYYQQELLDAEDLISDIKSALFRYRKDSYGIYVSDKEEKALVSNLQAWPCPQAGQWKPSGHRTETR